MKRTPLRRIAALGQLIPGIPLLDHLPIGIDAQHRCASERRIGTNFAKGGPPRHGGTVALDDRLTDPDAWVLLFVECLSHVLPDAVDAAVRLTERLRREPGIGRVAGDDRLRVERLPTFRPCTCPASRGSPLCSSDQKVPSTDAVDGRCPDRRCGLPRWGHPRSIQQSGNVTRRQRSSNADVVVAWQRVALMRSTPASFRRSSRSDRVVPRKHCPRSWAKPFVISGWQRTSA